MPQQVISDKYKALDVENLTDEQFNQYKNEMPPDLYKKSLYIGEIHFSASEVDILTLPGVEGKAIGIKLPGYHNKEHVVNWRGHPGFCYIHFETEDDVKHAFRQINSTRPVKLHGREVFADYQHFW